MTSRLIGADKLRRRLDAIENGRPILQTIQLRAVAEAKSLVPRKTGHTARTIAPGGIGDRYAIVQAAGAAPFLEFGTRPHVIRPRKAGSLSWPADGSGRRLSGRARTNSGRRIFARVVHHPGTKAQPFLLPGAIAAVRSVGIKSVVDAWNDAA
jgi:hypothetical protein